ncbi:MAG: IS5 family transposase [Mesorhizobium sp.]|uniref:IS5 family transposase n=3 Tax=Mesorhizobium sp. TaxID=1871066 RepID=UPI000FEA78CC|nr:IS5 family transposase [Mesorhizobium sp.]RWL03929.1 MAG: IS5 family transposase [Mesorhizobium sp.]TIP58894.1 MAG: IS5 family transposase [Mesorhizobium sp.]TIP69229.1 MAG: IS5 family transposase [Mesorhizobium sp.]TIR47307.1 MAG: IS5 family transposase [Mesorhizobium sp.]TJV76463.1 MAG: IS5 family transposase [Mesorhizobium sp.]
MRPKERRDSGQADLLRSRLDQILNMEHALVKLAAAIDWRCLEEKLGEVYDDGPGRPPLPTRLMAGLAILKSMHNLSDEGLCERWLENPYYQLFCGEEFFQHHLVFDRTSLTRWRLRMGEERLTALLQESLAAATRLGAAKPADFRAVIVDTTVQEKAITFPTDAKLMHRARERLVKLAGKHGIRLRQSYARVGKIALIKHQRYAHAKQFKRANRQLKRLRTMLGAVIRDITRKIAGRPELMAPFGLPLSLARRVRDQRQRERGRKVYSLHAPEVECIGKGKAHKPYEFGVKVSVATPLYRSRGGQFVAHIKALPGNPYDGHTLATILPAIENSIGANLAKIVADAGYRGHNAPKDKTFKVHVAGYKRGLTKAVKRALRRRSAVEPVIGHLKSDHRMGRNFLAFSQGDANNAVLAAVGYNFSLLLNWLRLLCALFLAMLTTALTPPLRPRSA